MDETGSVWERMLPDKSNGGSEFLPLPWWVTSIMLSKLQAFISMLFFDWHAEVMLIGWASPYI